MMTATELKTQILTKAAEDDDFRTRLLTDPKAAISAETGVTIPQGATVVHEDSTTTAHLVLPPSPALTEAELEKVAGGDHYWYAQSSTAPG